MDFLAKNICHKLHDMLVIRYSAITVELSKKVRIFEGNPAGKFLLWQAEGEREFQIYFQKCCSDFDIFLFNILYKTFIFTRMSDLGQNKEVQRGENLVLQTVYLLKIFHLESKEFLTSFL